MFPTTWHCKNTKNCIFISILTFSFCAYICLPLNISLLCGIITSLFLTYILYKIKYYEEFNNVSNLTLRQNDLLIAIRQGIKGEQLIDYMLNKGYDFSKSTRDREVKNIKEKLNIQNLKGS